MSSDGLHSQNPLNFETYSLSKEGSLMKRYMLFIVVSICVVLYFSNTSTFAKVSEHAVIKPIPKSLLDKSSEHKNHIYEFPFYDEKTNIVSYQKIKGTFRKMSYNIFGKDPQRLDGIYTSVEIIRTYKNFALNQGGKILWERGLGGRLSFTISKPGGDKIWCQVIARNGHYELDIIEKEPLINVTPSAKKMKKKLDVEGRVTIYSILFDFDKSDLRNKSKKSLNEIGELLSGYPKLKIEIQGHTDNQGNDVYNLKLSQKRAESVKFYLVRFGVDTSRLTAKGYGSAKPVSSNNTKEGRAKNRRVVLVER